MLLADGALDDALSLVNSSAPLGAVLDALFDFPGTRLAAYGTLQPGESNHSLMDDVAGTWAEGTVHGTRFMSKGYPAFLWRTGEDRVPVSVLSSPALPAHWARLDAFEGPDYCRILVPVRLSNGATVVANLYEYIGGPPNSG